MTVHHHCRHHQHRDWRAPACQCCPVCDSDQAAWALGSLVLAPLTFLAALVGWLTRRPRIVAGLAVVWLVALAAVAVVDRGVLQGREIAGHLAAAGITWAITQVWRAARRSTRDRGPQAQPEGRRS